MRAIRVMRPAAVLCAVSAVPLGTGAALAAEPLPYGVHRASDGRYYQDVTDWGAHRHAMSRRLLPGYAPPTDVTPAAGQQSFCAAQTNPHKLLSPPAGSLGPTEIAAAYQIPATASAGGKIVAVVDMPDTTAAADLATYRAAYGLPALPACTSLSPLGPAPCFAAVDEIGAGLNPTVTDCAGADGETGLDIEMVSAACPDCTILLVQMTEANQTLGPADEDFLTSAATAATLGAVATSMSFGGPEGNGSTADPIGYTTPGHLVLAASGDSGYLLEGEASQDGNVLSPSYPGSAPDVLGVGGTTLAEQSGGGYSEVVWNDNAGATGSGCSTEFSMPAFQKAFGGSKFGTCAMRASVDLSAAATYVPTHATALQGGIAEYDAQDSWVQVVGTSAATPMVAGILTRLGLAGAVSANLGFLYTNASAFNDVVSGTNDGFGSVTECTSDTIMCTAGPGWDGPTGLGTPNGPALATLGAEIPSSSSSSSGGTGGDGGTSGGGNAGPGSSSGCHASPGLPGGGMTGLLAIGAMGLLASRRRRR